MTRADIQAFGHVQLALPGMAREPAEDADVWREIYADRTRLETRFADAAAEFLAWAGVTPESAIVDTETGSPPVRPR